MAWAWSNTSTRLQTTPECKAHEGRTDGMLHGQSQVADDYGALETVMTEVAQSAAEPVARMRAIGMAFCRFAEENPGSYRLITVVVQPVPALGPRAEGHPAARVQKILQRAIADCQAAGLAADVDPEVLRPACGAGGTASSSCVSPSPSVSGPRPALSSISWSPV